MWCALSLLVFFLDAHQRQVAAYTIANLQSEKDQSYWVNKGKEHLQEAKATQTNHNIAKNVVVFIGDGMGPSTVTAGRIFKNQRKDNVSGEEGYSSFESFPNVGLLKTYNLNTQVTDSAASATAYLGGVKANHYTVGVNGKVALGDCDASLVAANHVNSVLKWAQDAGKDTGIVTTARITHATPAALYAHSAHREWECDAEVDDSVGTKCKDIAKQLAENTPGKNINVVLAGGRNPMGAYIGTDADSGFCIREDGKNMTDKWLQGKTNAKYVTSLAELNGIDVTKHEHIMGLFSGSHITWEYDRKYGDATDALSPSLKDLTLAALKRLQTNNTCGFFLLVEGGRIDHGHHATKPRLALEEFFALDDAIEAALGVIDTSDTLVIVTADHSHAMTLNGYPDRGNDILGTYTYDSIADDMPSTTLTYALTPNAGYDTTTKNAYLRTNLTSVNTTERDYIPTGAVPVKDGKGVHQGEEVELFAKGPMSHMFQRVHENTYLAHVVSYAACMGPLRAENDLCNPLPPVCSDNGHK